MIKIGVRLTNGEAKVEEFPNLGGSYSIEKTVFSPGSMEIFKLRTLFGGHSDAYNTATRIAGNMQHNAKTYGDKISDQEWAAIKHHVTRNESLALEEKRFFTFLNWVQKEISGRRVKNLKYRITPGARVTKSREITHAGLDEAARSQLIEAIISML